MFYSETLLSKTGPLARVWLSANLERKLSKTHILQSNIETSVSAIVDQGQAPMALRLSGQLLLGVVRIYSRKARYLLDDCNEALLKIKMAFRPGNVDLPANQLHAHNPAALTLPDVLTELDLLPPLPDASLLLADPAATDLRGTDDFTLGEWSSQLLPDSIEQGRNAPAQTLELEEDDLGLDIGEDLIPGVGNDTSVHMGRDAPAPRAVGDDIIDDDMKLPDDDLGLDIGDGPSGAIVDDDGAFNFAGDEDMDMAPPGLDSNMGLENGTIAQTPGRLDRDSPLSSIRSSVDREYEQSMLQDEEQVRQAHRAKKRRILQADEETTLHSHQIKSQQEDRSAILKPASFLPRDPLLLSLMELQRTGGFVSSIMGDGRARGLAPELRGILSIEVVRRSGELKRKRDSGIADMGDEELEGPTGEDTEIFNLPDDDQIRPPVDDDDMGLERQTTEAPASPQPDFDETTAPLVHPADSGPVSLGTTHAVHLLREQFADTQHASPSQRSKTSVLFQDLLPEGRATKVDATKMFFETLVLATKDAIKVEQTDSKTIGAPIRVRAKRGLWGAWAEQEAGGEIAGQSQAGQGAAPVEVQA